MYCVTIGGWEKVIILLIFVQSLQIANPDGPSYTSDAAAKGRNFYKVLTTKSALYFLFFYWDVVIALSMFSESLQQRSVCIGDVYQLLESCKSTLDTYRER